MEGALNNYRSYEEESEAADTLFQKEVDKGFVHWAEDKTELVANPSAIGYIAKVRLGGTVKGRLVHDLRRSQVNSHISLKERLVLPRLKDAMEDALHLLETRTPNERVRFMSLDFSDAFKHLTVRENEYKYLSGRALGGYFVYRTVLFGVKTGPLVWGRVAALIARSTQALFHPSRCRLQIFVDDPLIVARGTEAELNSIFNIVLLWWLALGLKVAWTKGALGIEAEWIGAKLVINDSEGFVKVMVTAVKLEEWRGLLERLDTKPLVGHKPLQQFTGKMSWAAGFIPQLKPFVRMLYAALASIRENCKVRGKCTTGKSNLPFDGSSASYGAGGQKAPSLRSQQAPMQAGLLGGGGAVKLRAGQPVEVFAISWTAAEQRSRARS